MRAKKQEARDTGFPTPDQAEKNLSEYAKQKKGEVTGSFRRAVLEAVNYAWSQYYSMRDPRLSAGVLKRETKIDRAMAEKVRRRAISIEASIPLAPSALGSIDYRPTDADMVEVSAGVMLLLKSAEALELIADIRIANHNRALSRGGKPKAKGQRGVRIDSNLLMNSFVASMCKSWSKPRRKGVSPKSTNLQGYLSNGALAVAPALYRDEWKSLIARAVAQHGFRIDKVPLGVDPKEFKRGHAAAAAVLDL